MNWQRYEKDFAEQRTFPDGLNEIEHLYDVGRGQVRPPVMTQHIEKTLYHSESHFETPFVPQLYGSISCRFSHCNAGRTSRGIAVFLWLRGPIVFEY